MQTPLYRLGMAEAARRLETGALTATQLTRACLERIEERNGAVQAFVAHDPALALHEAAEVDAGRRGGALKGIPFAAKDTIESADYPTTFGSPIYAGHRAGRDAGCIARAREQGAVLLGKVATSEFATQTPGRARNPLNLGHTPGGSSSGSAAAVADGMALAAWGTQTTGSIIRPAVYCGIVGYKPSFGLVSTSGVGVLSPVHDTVGVLARSVQDAALFTFGVHGAKAMAEVAAQVQPQAGARALRLGVCLSSQWDEARPETRTAIEDCMARAARAGAQVRQLRLPAPLEALLPEQPRIVAYEARHALAHESRVHPQQLSPRLTERLASARGMDVHEYLALQQQVVAARQAALALFDEVDVLVYPATEGEPETGLDHSGSPRFGALWTLLHLPTVAFPVARGPLGLPLGLQVVGRFGHDVALLHHAAAVQQWADY
ncbi:MAG: amidase [Pseudomonadota bacterium]